MAAYATQTGAGAHDGTSEANAWSASEYAAATIAPNATIYLGGILTSNFATKAVGTNFVMLPGAVFSSPIWSNVTGAVFLNHANSTLDGGGTVATWGTRGWTILTNGIIENTANGSGLANSAPSRGVQIGAVSGCTVKGLWVRNIYQRTDDADLNDNDSRCISAKANGGPINGYTVFGCLLDNAYAGIEGDYSVGCSNYRFSYITATRCNWGIGVGDRGAGTTLDGVYCDHISVSDWTNWNNPGPNAYHHNGIFIFSNHNDAIVDGIEISCCHFGPGWGDQFQTAGIYMNTGIRNPVVFNNLFVANTGEYAGNGFITMQSTSATTFGIYNNTFNVGGTGTCIQLAGSGNGNAITMNVKNNVGVGNGGGTFIALYTNPNVTLNADYNWGFGFTPALAYSDSVNGSGNFKTFAQWQGLGFDAHGSNADPDLANNDSPNSGSPIIAAGVNLSSIFSTDILGRSRPMPATLWSVGAYEGPYGPDHLIVTAQGTGVVTELYKRALVGGIPTFEVVQHSGQWPQNPPNNYVYAEVLPPPGQNISIIAKGPHNIAAMLNLRNTLL